MLDLREWIESALRRKASKERKIAMLSFRSLLFQYIWRISKNIYQDGEPYLGLFFSKHDTNCF